LENVSSREFIDRLVREYRDCVYGDYSVEKILYCLTRAIEGIEWYAALNNLGSRELARLFLEKPFVKRSLSTLAYHKYSIDELLSNPVYSVLRDYTDLIYGALSSTSPYTNEISSYYKHTTIPRFKDIVFKVVVATLIICISLYSITYFGLNSYTGILGSSGSSSQELVVLRNYALEILNSERRKHGVPELTLWNPDPNPAQIHAEEMVRYNYISHWDRRGYKPHVRWAVYGYTWFGVSESIAYAGVVNGVFRWDLESLKEEIREAIENMIYHDEASNWGHRDDLLNPIHNKVAIGIAWDSDSFALVINCINDHIDWVVRPRISNGVLVMEGYIPKRFISRECSASISCIDVYVFKDEKPYPLINPGKEKPRSWDLGKAVAGVLPSGSTGYYSGLDTIYVDKYVYRGVGDSVWFHIELDLSVIASRYGYGVYGVYIMVSDNLYRHPYLHGDYVYPLDNIVIYIDNGTMDFYK